MTIGAILSAFFTYLVCFPVFWHELWRVSVPACLKVLLKGKLAPSYVAAKSASPTSVFLFLATYFKHTKRHNWLLMPSLPPFLCLSWPVAFFASLSSQGYAFRFAGYLAIHGCRRSHGRDLDEIPRMGKSIKTSLQDRTNTLFQRLADLPANPEFEVVRVLYLGNDIDGQLRTKGFPIQVIPFVVSLSDFLYDLAVAKAELERFHALLQPALTADNEEKSFHEFFRHERLTENDLLVQHYGKAQAARTTLDEFDKHSLTCWENARPWLEGEIKSLQAGLRRQGLDILRSAVCKRLAEDYLSFHGKCGQYISEAELNGDLSRLRQQSSRFAAGDWDPVKVGDIQVVFIEQDRIKITVFLPELSQQGEKRSGMEWLHGGKFSIWLQVTSLTMQRRLYPRRLYKRKSSLTRWCRSKLYVMCRG